mmetsp:Transcript_118361/g.377298  ORF Transcript_118361/g.377298 Transcript_118361/m.377298 type:complete len:121 (+) Transcript_118361:298-660(+)
MVRIADADAAAYAELQATWKKDCTLSDDEKKAVQDRVLAVPCDLLRLCHAQAEAVADFLPQCNPGIISDAKVALHLLAGAGRAAYQTVAVNNPPEELNKEMVKLVRELGAFEDVCMPRFE